MKWLTLSNMALVLLAMVTGVALVLAATWNGGWTGTIPGDPPTSALSEFPTPSDQHRADLELLASVLSPDGWTLGQAEVVTEGGLPVGVRGFISSESPKLLAEAWVCGQPVPVTRSSTRFYVLLLGDNQDPYHLVPMPDNAVPSAADLDVSSPCGKPVLSDSP